MSLSVLITNLATTATPLSELYISLGAAGASNASVTITCSAAQLDSMVALKGLVNSATVSVAITQSADNSDLMSLPIEQHGTVGNLAVDAIAVVTSVVTFAKPFPVVPTILIGIRRGAQIDWKGQVYQQAVLATGFTISLDVTTASVTAGAKGSVSWMAVL